MKKRKLNYRFFNPNSVEETAEYILKVFMEVNAEKVEQAIRKEMDENPALHSDAIEKHSA